MITPEHLAAWERDKERARWERTNRRTFILCIILAVLLAISVTYIMIRENQFQQVTTTSQDVEQIAEGDGDIQFVGGDYNGK